MITAKLQGGLGNQMFQYAAGRSLAIQFESPLVLDTHFMLRPPPGVTPWKVEIDAFAINATFQDTVRDSSPFTSNRVLRKLKASIGAFLSNEVVLTDSNISQFLAKSLLEKDVYLDGYWQNLRFVEPIREYLLRDFKLSRSWSEESLRLSELISRSDSISLHVRRGDYLSNVEAANLHCVQDVGYYARAVRLIREELGDAPIFVFSDDQEWCKSNFDFGKNVHFVCDFGVKSMHEELLLMSQCRANINANSTFSWWAAWLNEHPLKLVIAPAPSNWHKGATLDLSGLIPSSWKLL